MKQAQRKWHKKTAVAAAVMAALSPSAQFALAQDNESDGTDPTVEEILVIGEFQQSLVDRIPVTPKELPFTLNVVDRAYLDARNFNRPIEALTTLPNVAMTEDRLGTGTPNFLVRGFEAPVLVDNRVQNGFRGSGARDNSFVDRYEVLKGPASIALGPVQSGGVINTVTKTPTRDEFYGIDLRADQFGSVGAEFDANFGDSSGSDNALFRISGAYRDFQFDADETKRETVAIRPVVTFKLGENTTAKASVSYTEHEVNPNKGFPLTPDNEIPSQIGTNTFTGFANGMGDIEDVYYEAQVNHQFLDNLKLTVRGSRQTTDFDYQNVSGVYDYGYGFYSYSYRGETDSESTFLDAQLAYQTQRWGQQQDIVVGVSYNESDFERLFSPFPGVGPFTLESLVNPRVGQDSFTDLSPFSLFDNEVSSIYAEAALRPNEWLTVIGGVRYDDVDQVSTRFRRGEAFETGLVDDEVTFRVGATIKVSDDVNVFASFAQAFTPQSGIRRDNSPVGPELSNGFEVGAKGSLFNDVLQYEAGLFYTLREDVAVSDPTNGGDEFFTVNVGELRAQGLELTGNLNPVEGLNIDLNFGYTDTDITEAGDDEVVAAVFPEVTASAYLSYELQSGSLQGLTLGGGFRYVDERGLGGIFPSHTVADLNASYAIKENMTIALDFLNVTDELYIETASAFAGPSGGAVLGSPRTAVVTLRTRF
ncbi:MAG: TonB-dependent siderophore receptor [Pseudomonadota bacterium]